MDNEHHPPLYRAAVIGLGFVGAGDQVSGDALGQQVANLDGTHARALATHARVTLAAGSSRDEGRRTRFAQRTGVEATYADWRRMLDVERPDIVSVATYSPQHADITIACAEAGVRAVLCEKPIATNLRDADRMIETCRRSGTVLAVNHNRRWNPLWRRVRDEVRAGAIGRIERLAIHWQSGRLGNVGTHMFDAAAFLIDSRAQAVSGTLDSVVRPDCRGPEFLDPGGWGIVAFENGVRAFVDASQESKSPREFMVVGSLGRIAIDREEAELVRWNGEGLTLLPPPEPPSSVWLAVDDIVNCLDHGRQPASTGDDARQALEVIIGFHVSDRRRGQWVELPLAGDDRNLEVRIG